MITKLSGNFAWLLPSYKLLRFYKLGLDEVIQIILFPKV